MSGVAVFAGLSGARACPGNAGFLTPRSLPLFAWRMLRLVRLVRLIRGESFAWMPLFAWMGPASLVARSAAPAQPWEGIPRAPRRGPLGGLLSPGSPFRNASTGSPRSSEARDACWTCWVRFVLRDLGIGADGCLRNGLGLRDGLGPRDGLGLRDGLRNGARPAAQSWGGRPGGAAAGAAPRLLAPPLPRLPPPRRHGHRRGGGEGGRGMIFFLNDFLFPFFLQQLHWGRGRSGPAPLAPLPRPQRWARGAPGCSPAAGPCAPCPSSAQAWTGCISTSATSETETSRPEESTRSVVPVRPPPATWCR